MAAEGRYVKLCIVKSVFCLAAAAHVAWPVPCTHSVAGRQKIPLD